MIVRYAAPTSEGPRAALDESLLYVVLEMHIGGARPTVRVYDPVAPDEPTIWPLEDCRVVDDRVAPSWTVIQRDGAMTLAPASWQVDGFWTRFWEGEVGSADNSDVAVIGLSPDLPLLSWSRRADDVHAAYRRELDVILTASGFAADGGVEQFRIR